EEQCPPYFPVWQRGWYWHRGVDDHRFTARHAERNDRLITFLEQMSLRTRPFLHRFRRLCVCHLGLQSVLGLHGLCGKRLHLSALVVQTVQLLRPGIELNDEQDQKEAPSKYSHASELDGNLK